MGIGGRITESGTYRELVGLFLSRSYHRSDNDFQVTDENSRFRALMAAQLNAAAGESLYIDRVSEVTPTDI